MLDKVDPPAPDRYSGGVTPTERMQRIRHLDKKRRAARAREQRRWWEAQAEFMAEVIAAQHDPDEPLSRRAIARELGMHQQSLHQAEEIYLRRLAEERATEKAG